GGVIAGFATLKAESAAQGGALLEPAGITVDPTSHEVIILGEVDEGTSEQPAKHFALQRITEAGVAGKRYVSPKTVSEEGGVAEEGSDSPAVSQTGRVFFERTNELMQVPVNETGAPSVAFGFGAAQKLFRSFGSTSTAAANEGAVLSYAPGAGDEGTFYVSAELNRFALKEGKLVEGGSYPAVLALNYAQNGEAVTVSEHGWTGGQEEGRCSIGFLGESYAMVAGGEKSKLFVLSSPTLGSNAVEILEFGPGGGGCPTAAAAPMRAEVSGKEITGSENVPAGTAVKLSSELTANAVGVEWSFSNGEASEAGGPGAYQEPALTHAFKNLGEVTVTEKIQTDDLETPEITIVKKLVIAAAPPTAVLRGPSSATVGQEVEFSGSASSDPNGESLKYHWTFGDGEKAETSTPTIKHTYHAAGSYTAELVVSDPRLSSKAATLTIKVETPRTETTKTETTSSPTATTPVAATPTAATPTAVTPKAAVLAFGPGPDAKLAATSVTVSSSGTLVLKVSCPAGESSCVGTVTLRTLNAISAGKGRHKAVLTLATGSFTVLGGHVKAVTLHLSAKARALLSRSHTLRVRATITAHDSTGTKHTTLVLVTLRAQRHGKH
ncbi:MAG: PKD domain-containing protein, partial [Solirubrobacteraceae bacterium]